MSKFFDVSSKRIIGAGVALASVAAAFVIGSTPAKADWHRDHWVEHDRYYHRPYVYAPPVVYGPPVVYERPVYAPPPPVYYGAPGINVTIPLR